MIELKECMKKMKKDEKDEKNSVFFGIPRRFRR